MQNYSERLAILETEHAAIVKKIEAIYATLAMADV